jgi:alpha-N-acetylglucosamine transferase
MTGKIQKAAWAVILTSANKYVAGIAVLAHTLQKHASKYPLVVLYTAETVPDKVVARLSSYGCIMIAIEAIKPLSHVEYKFERFAETWTKLRVWEQTDYDRLVLMDADMLPLQNMDELMTIPLTTDVVAACHACTCNPQKISHYPSSW